MPDREKVINEFSECVQREGWTHCGNCEYKNTNVLLTCKPLAKEILTMLKKQEAEWLEVDDKHDAFDCSNCGAMAGRKCLYCPGCGAKMKNGTRAMEGR